MYSYSYTNKNTGRIVDKLDQIITFTSNKSQIQLGKSIKIEVYRKILEMLVFFMNIFGVDGRSIQNS